MKFSIKDKIQDRRLKRKLFTTDEFMQQFVEEFLEDKETRFYTEEYARYLDEKGTLNTQFSNIEDTSLQNIAYRSIVEANLNNIFRTAYVLKEKGYDWKLAKGFAMGASIVIRQDDSKQHLHFFFALAALALQKVYSLSKDNSWELIRHSCEVLDRSE